ncbi:hypothetical protein HAX54_044677, partial [Datura stramonium]|nr:hypothetical protein [Datura stramonium]
QSRKGKASEVMMVEDDDEEGGENKVPIDEEHSLVKDLKIFGRSHGDQVFQSLLDPLEVMRLEVVTWRARLYNYLTLSFRTQVDILHKALISELNLYRVIVEDKAAAKTAREALEQVLFGDEYGDFESKDYRPLNNEDGPNVSPRNALVLDTSSPFQNFYIQDFYIMMAFLLLFLFLF